MSMSISVESVSSSGVAGSKGMHILILVEIYCQGALVIQLAKFSVSPAMDENAASSHPRQSQYGCQTDSFFSFAKLIGKK